MQDQVAGKPYAMGYAVAWNPSEEESLWEVAMAGNPSGIRTAPMAAAGRSTSAIAPQFCGQMEDTRGEVRKSAPPASAAAAAAAARITILLMAAVVFVGWLVMWAVFPTRTYSSTWAPKLATLTGFGKQGMRMMLFVTPVLFFYVIACVYLHLHKDTDPDTQRRTRTSISLSC